MKIKHTDLSDALTRLSEERIEEALLLDSAESLSKAKNSEKEMRARTARPQPKRRFTIPLCAALLLAAVLPLTIGWLRHNRNESEGGNTTVNIGNPWVYVETVKELCDAMRIRLPDLPRSKTAKNCAVLSPDGGSLSDAEMGDILFSDGSRLRLRVIGPDLPDASEMDRVGGVYGAALTQKTERGDVTVFHFRTSDSSFAAWIDGGVYYWYEPTSPDDTEQMLSVLLPGS